MNIDEVKQTIGRGNEAAKQGRETLERGVTEARDAGMLAQRVTHNSAHDHVTQMSNKLNELRLELERTVRRYESAVEHANS
nr:hypothetical protein [Micromonospora sp. DSM 115978]